MGATITTNATAVDPTIAGKGYVHPEVLVSTEWLAEHLDDEESALVNASLAHSLAQLKVKRRGHH